MDIKTENRDKYVPFEPQKRPPLYKKDTNLHLEGSLDLLTEKRQKFLPFEVHERPSATKREANLHLEGDLQLQPEYREAYVEYKVERYVKKYSTFLNKFINDLFYAKYTFQ